MSATPERIFEEARERCPFHAVVGPRGEGRPLRGAWAIEEGPVLPVPDEVHEAAAEAFARGGTFLIMARSSADREVAKRALQLRFGRSGGRA